MNGVRVLLVEDEAIIAKDLQRTLEGLGFEVVGRSPTGDEAVVDAERHRPDLVLMDIQLPGSIDGVTAATRIRDRLHVPVVFLSAFSDPETVGRALAAGPYGYVTKPFTETGLRCAVEVALQRAPAEAVARRRERLLTTALRSIGDGVLALDPIGRIAFVNPAAAALLGTAEGGLTGARTEDLPRLREEAGDEVAWDRVGADHRDLVLLRAGGSPIPVDVSVSPILDEEEVRLGDVVVLRDLRREQAAARDLAASERQYRELLDRIPDVAWSGTADGRRLTFVSSAIERVCGYTPAEVTGAADGWWMTRVHPEDRARLPGGGGWPDEAPREYRFRHRDGRWIWLQVRRGPGTVRDGVVTCDGLFSDVTHRRQTEEELRQFQKLEAIGQLTGGVAHDFNNILAVILANGEFLASAFGDADPELTDVQEIIAAAQRAGALTRQLLAFSRRQVLEPVALDLNEVVAGIEAMLRRLVREDVAVRLRLADGIGTVVADRGQVEQVVMNLVVNAQDAMPHGGELTMHTANVELDESYAATHVIVPPGRYVMLSVSDTGVGMDAETMSRIFEPFFTTKERGKGTGLGLSTCYGIVRQSGGYIFVYSEPGHGSEFKVYLPRRDGPVSRPEVPVATPRPRGTETVLVIEDDAAVRRTTCKMLSEYGYRVIEAAGAQQALRLVDGMGAEARAIRLIVSDVVMPGLSGVEAVGLIRHTVPDVRVLFTSGYTDHVAFRDGAIDRAAFIQKPFGVDALMRKVRAVLDG